MTPSVFIGLSGKSRIGKTTMLNWLTNNYEVTNCSPGEALKVMWSFSQNADYCADMGAHYLKRGGYSELLECLQEDTSGLLYSYEYTKKESIKERKGDEFRKQLIGFAEMWRAFYPEIWCKLAKELFYVEGQVAFGEILNQGEYRILRNQYDYVLPIGLACAEPAEGGGEDSRGDISCISTSYSYAVPEESLSVAKQIVFDYNEFGTFQPPNILLPSIEEKPF